MFQKQLLSLCRRSQQEVLGFCFSCHTGYLNRGLVSSRVFFTAARSWIATRCHACQPPPGEQSRWIPGFWFSNVGGPAVGWILWLKKPALMGMSKAISVWCRLWFHWEPYHWFPNCFCLKNPLKKQEHLGQKVLWFHSWRFCELRRDIAPYVAHFANKSLGMN